MTITGDYFVASNAGEPYVTSVVINGLSSPSFIVHDRHTVSFITPAGVGAQLDVQVRTRGGFDSDPQPLWRYSQPIVLDT